MTWWGNVYLTAISMLAIGNALEERKLGFGPGHILMSLCSILVLVIGVLAFLVDTVSLTFGKWVLPLMVLSLGWGIYAGIATLRRMTPFDDLTASQNSALRRIAIVISTAILSPGYAAGFYAGLTAW